MKTFSSNGHSMGQCWILLLCAAGISGGLLRPRSVRINPPPHDRIKSSEGGIRRFACPVGFFRLRRNCYYLSAGTAPWREAYFHCKDRNSTLAVLDKNGKDKILRKYLMGEQFTKLERWIGGIYNWQQMAWEWGVSGDKILFQNFEKLEPSDPNRYAWHCIVMDPSVTYKWKPRSCVEKKHYICEVPAGRIGRRRRKRIDSSLAPQNQRQKPTGNRRKGKARGREGNTGRKGDGSRRRNRVHQAWMRNWESQNNDQPWVHGENLGSRPPGNMRRINTMKTLNRTRHRPIYNAQRDTPKIAQMVPQGQEYRAFLGDGPAKIQPQALSEENIAINQFSGRMNDLAHEEILLKT